LNPDGSWGQKQRREYLLDENGERIKDDAGHDKFNAVPTTDWGDPETLEFWREKWAELCNAKFEEKGLTERIDHRSYERQGIHKVPTIHEGPAVRAMERKGIRTEKGDFNRWVRATNKMMDLVQEHLDSLTDWIGVLQSEMDALRPKSLAEVMNVYYDQRNAGAYGYRPYKLPGVKGNSLRIEPEEAKVVQMIYDMYGKQGMGYNAIAYALNDMHIPARKGEWSQTSIVNILTNEVYLGKIRWRREPVKKVVKDGFLAKTRILNDDYELYDGMHEPIITEEQWEMVKAAQKKRNHASVNTDRQLQNPFAGILVCGKCGAIMKRTVPDKRRNPTPWFRCTTRGCDCKIIKCEVVENSIRDAMQEWLDNYMIQIEANQQPKVDPITTALEAVRGQLAQLQSQQERIGCGNW